MKYFIYVRLTSDNKFEVMMDRRDGRNSGGMTMGVHEKPEQASTVAEFLMTALHEKHVQGLNEGYNDAITRLTACVEKDS